MEEFEPLPDTHKHGLVDSCYLSKWLWKVASKCRWDLTGRLKSDRPISLEDSQGAVSWPTVSEHARGLANEDFQAVLWPRQEGGQIVFTHLLLARLKKLTAGFMSVPVHYQPAAARAGAGGNRQDSLAETCAWFDIQHSAQRQLPHVLGGSCWDCPITEENHAAAKAAFFRKFKL